MFNLGTIMNIKKLFCLNLLVIAFLSLNTCSTSNNISNQTDLVINYSNSNNLIDLYPVKPGTLWTYELDQYQNGVPNDKFKEMRMEVISTENEGNVISAIINRSYPNADIYPRPTLAQIYPDHIALSRYTQQVFFDTSRKE